MIITVIGPEIDRDYYAGVKPWLMDDHDLQYKASFTSLALFPMKPVGSRLLFSVLQCVVQPRDVGLQGDEVHPGSWQGELPYRVYLLSLIHI